MNQTTFTKEFRHVKYLWDEDKARSMTGDEIALLLYRSNILGADLRVTNYGGGNTSCKTMEPDPLSGELVEVMWIKGSGGDIGTLKRDGLAGLYLERLHALKKRYRGLKAEDEMVALFSHCIYDLDSRAPSIDTPLHAFLPFKHIDHLHPDAVIAIAACADGERLTQEIFKGEIGWVPWQRPGFDLGLKLEECLAANPDIRGIMLGGHGLFTWGDTAYECYVNSLDVIERASEYIERHLGKKRPVFGGERLSPLAPDRRRAQAAALSPLLRGLCSSERLMVGHFTDAPAVLEFICSKDLERLAPMGTSCPDHFLRTKIRPLVLDLAPEAGLDEPQELRERLARQYVVYRQAYQEYYETHCLPDSPAMRDANPVVIIWPGVGMYTFAKDKQTARVASEFYVNAINVMRGAEAISRYVALPPREAFNIEYWLLEEAKLQRMPPEKPLSRRVALITGAAGGIGKAIAEKLAREGACVMLTDLREEDLLAARRAFGHDQASHAVCNVADEAVVRQAYNQACLEFGGVDIIVNCAGLAISKPLEKTTPDDWDVLQDVIVKGQFLVSKAGVEVMKRQGVGGDIVNIASKNALVAGPNNVGYGAAKAAQAHMSRLMAAELGENKIRVNVVNPDAVIVGSKIWEGEWAEKRAEVYGVSIDQLPAYYASRTLLKEVILPEDIANAVFAFTGGLLNKSTGNILNVDGGIAPAFVR
jgi:rhamnulose-1-phosphate aldolase/alcohol dehydrogenase